MEKSSNIIILGPQGSGKGTQAKLLSEKFGYYYVGTGDASREVAATDTPLGQRVKGLITSGQLVDDETITEILKQKLLSIGSVQPVVLDGYPRNEKQYELLKNLWRELGRKDYVFVNIELAEEAAVARLSSRFICAKCGAIYIGNKGPCAKCGGELVQREDDRPDGVRKRLAIYNERTRPMIERIRHDNQQIFDIDGSPSVEDVHREILKKLKL